MKFWHKVAVAAASLITAVLVITLFLGIWNPTHTVGGEVVPTDAKKVCKLLAEDGLDDTGDAEGDAFSQEDYDDFRKWAEDVNDPAVSEGLLGLAAYFKPGTTFDDEDGFGRAFMMLSAFEDLAKACRKYDVNLEDAMSTPADDGWEMSGEEEPLEVAPDTELWLTNWCDVKMGDTYDQVVEKMGAPTSDMREGDGDPQVSYDYNAYGFTVFFDTDDKVNSFWADYDSLGETDLAKLSCVSVDEYGMMDREDMQSSGY